MGTFSINDVVVGLDSRKRARMLDLRLMRQLSIIYGGFLHAQPGPKIRLMKQVKRYK
jgi:hypothetical protein